MNHSRSFNQEKASPSSADCGAQTFRNQRDDTAGDIDGRFYMPRISEMSDDVYSTHIGLESFRIIDRNFG